jgi:hypothetical protein
MVDLLDMNFFSEKQERLCQWKLESLSYHQIMVKFDPNLTHKQIKNAIWRSILGYKWEIRQHAGPLTVLAPADEKEFRKICISAKDNFKPLDWREAIDAVRDLVSVCARLAVILFQKFNCPKLLAQYESTPQSLPSRQWLNAFVERNILQLRKPRFVDEKRITACSISTIDGFFMKHGSLINSTPPSLIYGADETMLE